MPLILIGLVLNSSGLAMAGVALFGLVAVFQLVTLPVEFNASHRALVTLESRDILSQQEMQGARHQHDIGEVDAVVVAEQRKLLLWFFHRWVFSYYIIFAGGMPYACQPII